MAASSGNLNTKKSINKYGGPLIVFANDQKGWMLADGSLAYTTDRRATWQPLAADAVLKGTLRAYPAASKLSFTDSGTGWGWINRNSQKAHHAKA
jgi:hypothetical protein